MTWEAPNLDEYFEEDNLLLRGFEAQGFQAMPVVWNQHSIDWRLFDIALIRSTREFTAEPCSLQNLERATTCRQRL